MNYQIKMQIRAYKHMLYIFAVNRELHKKTTPELALHNQIPHPYHKPPVILQSLYPALQNSGRFRMARKLAKKVLQESG